MAMSKGMTGKIGPASVKQDTTLGDYIARLTTDAMIQKKKMDYFDWMRNIPDETWKLWESYGSAYIAAQAWAAAQENV